MTPSVIGAVLTGVSQIADDLVTTDEERLKLALQSREIDIREAQVQQAGDLAQAEVNKAEAASQNAFVSGWRPAIGWVCVLACAWNWIGLPVVRAALQIAGHDASLAPAPMDEMMPVLLGMLGLGALRTFEKVKRVAS
ncbi:MAG: 3TM-type holin [Afipia sp.]